MQCAVKSWFNSQYPLMGDLLMSIPNGVFTSQRKGAKLKKSGVVAGYPDMALFLSTNKHGALFVELKSTNGRVSKAQDSIHFQLTNQRYKVVVARSFDEAKAVIEDYLNGNKK